MSEYLFDDAVIEQSPWFKTALFSCESVDWATPADFYALLDKEFRFDLDPCPLYGARTRPDGLSIDWTGRRVYCNPPYGDGVGDWLAKHVEADVAVYLLPSRTDVKWFHRYAPEAKELRFIKGRLKFGNYSDGAPFPSMLMVFRKD